MNETVLRNGSYYRISMTEGRYTTPCSNAHSTMYTLTPCSEYQQQKKHLILRLSEGSYRVMTRSRGEGFGQIPCEEQGTLKAILPCHWGNSHMPRGPFFHATGAILQCCWDCSPLPMGPFSHDTGAILPYHWGHSPVPLGPFPCEAGAILLCHWGLSPMPLGPSSMPLGLSSYATGTILSCHMSTCLLHEETNEHHTLHHNSTDLLYLPLQRDN